MSQVDAYAIPGSPLNMAQLAARLEALFGAAASANRGTTAPDNPFQGMLWWDTSGTPTEVLRAYTVANGWRAMVNMNVDTGVVTFQGAALASRTITAGDGLSGGGDLSANRTLAVDGTVVRTSRTLTAGTGLTGGGDLSANRTLAVDSTVVRTSRTLTAGTGLTGGGDLSANRTMSIAPGGVGTNELAAGERLTTANVLQAVAGAAVGAVGTYAWLGNPSASASYQPGTNYAGSSLYYAGHREQNSGTTGTQFGPRLGDIHISGTSPGGTWKCMGAQAEGSTLRMRTTLFMRVA